MGNSTADILAQHGIIGVDEDILAHYGVPGMRWGKRRARNKARRAANDQRADARAKVKDMTDDDLKSAINRLKLEKEFKTLNAHELSSGQKAAIKILSQVGEQAAKNYVSGVANNLMAPGGLTSMRTKLAVAAAPKPKPRPVMQFNKNHGL